jgi:hypothetical protein
MLYLTYLNLATNKLTGTIPTELFDVNSHSFLLLSEVYLYANRLTV